MSKRDYLNELTQEEIEALVHTLGYELVYTIKDRDTGNPLSAIEKLPSEEKNDTALFIRCKALETEEERQKQELLTSALLKNPTTRKFAMTTMSTSMSFYNNKIGFLFIRKFDLTESLKDDLFSIFKSKPKEDEQSNQEKFGYFMADKFGEEYIKEYNKNVELHNKNLKKKKQEKKEQDLEM